MEQKPRLIGIDLLRGIAIYAVVILHLDEVILERHPSWTVITQFASFAVPFFLAASFYLSGDRLYVSDRPYNLELRLARVLVSYENFCFINQAEREYFDCEFSCLCF